MTSAESKAAQAIGRSRGGLTSRVVAVCDRAGRIAAISLAPGNRAEVKLADGLLDQIGRTGRFLADRAYDANKLRDRLSKSGADVVIPSTRNRKRPLPCDMDAYKARHLVENAFADLKQFRGIATRYCKLAVTFEAVLALVAWYVNTRPTRRGPQPPRLTGRLRVGQVGFDVPDRRGVLLRCDAPDDEQVDERP